MIARALPWLVLVSGCLDTPPSSVGDRGAPDAGGESALIPCAVPADCPDTGREKVCHCGSCAVPDPDCSPGILRWLSEDGKDGECAPAPIDLALGTQSSCLLWSDGRVSCWGDDCFGEVGDGGEVDCVDTVQYSVVPRLVRESTDGPAFGDVVGLSAGFRHVCAVRIDGSVWCWGSNGQGKLGADSTDLFATTPVQVVDDSGAALAGIVAIASGNDHVCALDGNGNAFCWGDNSYLQLGVAGIASRSVAAQTSNGTGFERLAAGGYHNCVARGDELFCWGRDSFGQLGFDSVIDPGSEDAHLVVYEQDPGMSLEPAAFGLGENFSCSATIGAEAWCWGSNAGHALGDVAAPTSQDGMNVASARAVAVALTSDPVQVVGGNSFACVRLEAESPICWGMNSVGQLGIGAPSGTPQGPTPLAIDVEMIDAGDDHACAITPERTVLCWGGNGLGQLGNGGATSSAEPTEVIDLCQ